MGQLSCLAQDNGTEDARKRGLKVIDVTFSWRNADIFSFYTYVFFTLNAELRWLLKQKEKNAVF